MELGLSTQQVGLAVNFEETLLSTLRPVPPTRAPEGVAADEAEEEEEVRDLCAQYYLETMPLSWLKSVEPLHHWHFKQRPTCEQQSDMAGYLERYGTHVPRLVSCLFWPLPTTQTTKICLPT